MIIEAIPVMLGVALLLAKNRHFEGEKICTHSPPPHILNSCVITEGKGSTKMKDVKIVNISKSNWKSSSGEFKVIKVEVTSPEENLYAVCTPIKLK